MKVVVLLCRPPPLCEVSLNSSIGSMYRISWISLCTIDPNYLFVIFTYFNLCLAEAIHNFKGVKIIHIWRQRL